MWGHEQHHNRGTGGRRGTAGDVFLTQLAVGERMSILYPWMAPGGEVPTHSHQHEQQGFVYKWAQTILLRDDVRVDIDPSESYFLENEQPLGAVSVRDEELLAIDVFSAPQAKPSTWTVGTSNGSRSATGSTGPGTAALLRWANTQSTPSSRRTGSSTSTTGPNCPRPAGMSPPSPPSGP